MCDVFYQHSNCLNFSSYQEGGVSRFYQGLGFALIQAPLARFVSTAANDGVHVFLDSFSATRDWGPGLTTLIGAFVVGIARLILMPIDTCKTVLQVDSKEGFKALLRRLRAGHVGVLYQGAVANAIASIMGHYPWCVPIFRNSSCIDHLPRLLSIVPKVLYV